MSRQLVSYLFPTVAVFFVVAWLSYRLPLLTTTADTKTAQVEYPFCHGAPTLTFTAGEHFTIYPNCWSGWNIIPRFGRDWSAHPTDWAIYQYPNGSTVLERAGEYKTTPSGADRFRVRGNGALVVK